MNEDTKTLTYWINLMRQIAITAHEGQFRRDKQTPYIKHVEAVANSVEDRLKPIAWGHDLIEDTSVTLDDLKNYGFPQYIIDGVDLITHRANVTNIEYWRAMTCNPDVVTVKLADIKVNLADKPTEHQREKYQRALKVFADAGFSS